MDTKFCYGCMQEKQQSPCCEHCGHDERTQNDVHQLPVGTVLKNQYIVGRVLGQGGFGITYIGCNLYLKKIVAIKEYFPTGAVIRDSTQSLAVTNCEGTTGTQFEANRSRFLREAQSLAQLSSIPGVVQVQDYFPENGTGYIVMEFVRGMTLKDYIQRYGLMDGKKLLMIFRHVLQVLRKVHEAGLIHRDISPDNIMMLPDGSVKLLDFGAVRDYGEKAQQHSTQAIVKHGFAPVEQYQSRGDLGPWTDLYALCATMYYCSTGRIPPDSMGRMIDGTALDWDQVPGLTPGQIRALEKGMAVRAGDRVQSAGELEELLFSGKTGGTGKKPLPPRPAPRKKLLLLLIPCLLLLGAAAAALLLPGKKEASGQAPGAVSAQQTQPPATLPEETQSATQPPTEPTTQPTTEPPTEPPTEPQEDHTVRMLMPMVTDMEEDEVPDAMGLPIPRDQVLTVTFLATVADAPEDAVDVSYQKNGQVLSWATPRSGGYDVFVAAEGGVWANYDCRNLFRNYFALESITFGDAFVTSETRDMTAMFMNCRSLKELDLSGFDTARVTGMNVMFGSCDSLERLDLGSFDVRNVTGMASMFSSCGALKEVDLGSFVTSSVKDMGSMFSFCSSLETLDLGSFDTSSVEDMSSMFSFCGQLSRVNVSSFDTSRVTDFSGMFTDTPLLTNVDGDFDTGSAKQAAEFMDPEDTFNGQPWKNIF